MPVIHQLYEKIIQWSSHPKAPLVLAGVSFAESSFFPLPPDLLLISMGLAQPLYVWGYALITTLSSVLGGIAGYMLGYYFFALIYPFIQTSHYQNYYLLVQTYFDQYGVWYVFIAGFTPIPYKIFTLAAGAMQMPIVPFVIASLLGRGGRFFLIALLMFFKGEAIEKHLAKHIQWLTWLGLIMFVALYGALKWWA